MMLTAEAIIAALGLQPHPVEGGWFRETYRSSDTIDPDQFSPPYPGPRSVGTAIYYLLTSGTFSAMHRLPGDEIFHFYGGDPVEMFLIRDDGTSEIHFLGANVLNGEHPQVVVPGGVWQGSSVTPAGKWALLGTTMAPGFDYADYETGRRDDLVARFPQHRDRIEALTRE